MSYLRYLITLKEERMAEGNRSDNSFFRKWWEKKWVKKIIKITVTVMIGGAFLMLVGISPYKAVDSMLVKYIPAYSDYVQERDRLNVEIESIEFYEKDYSKVGGYGIVSPNGIFEPVGNFSHFASYKPNLKILLNNKNNSKSVYSFYSTTDNDDTLIKEKTKLDKASSSEYTLDMNYSHGYNDDEGKKILYLIFVGELKDKLGYYCELDNTSITKGNELVVNNIFSEDELEKMTSGQQGVDISVSVNKAEILDTISQMKNQVE